MNTKNLLQALVRTSTFRMVYQVVYLILIKFWLNEEDATKIISALVPLVGYAFFAKSGFNTILHGVKESDIKSRITFSDILFFIFYFIYAKIISTEVNSIILLLSFVQYRILVEADIKLLKGNVRSYTRLNNLFYVLLLFYLTLFIALDFEINNQLISVIILSVFISVISILHGNISFDKSISTVQIGGVVSLSLGTVHSTKLEGEELVNFTLGKAVGELPFNYLGYHLSNLLHTGYISFTSRARELILFAISLVTGLVLFCLYVFGIDVAVFGESYILIAFGFVCLFPLQYVNTYFTRRLHRSNLILEGTVIQFITNGLSILLLAYNIDSWRLYLIYAMTFSLGSSLAFIMLAIRRQLAEK